MAKDLEDIKKAIKPILKKHAVKKAGIFGSFVRREQGEKSDIDILIEFENNNKTLLDLIALKLDLEDVLKRKVDVVEYPTIKPILKEAILKEQSLVL